jgi:hypothetical protein
MPMTPGSVTVASDGSWSGTGVAEVVMNVLRPDLVPPGAGAPFPPAPSPPVDPTPAQTAAFNAALAAYNAAVVQIGISNSAATLANAIAATLISYVVANAEITIPANAFGSGIPASPVTLSGAIE